MAQKKKNSFQKSIPKNLNSYVFSLLVLLHAYSFSLSPYFFFRKTPPLFSLKTHSQPTHSLTLSPICSPPETVSPNTHLHFACFFSTPPTLLKNNLPHSQKWLPHNLKCFRIFYAFFTVQLTFTT